MAARIIGEAQLRWSTPRHRGRDRPFTVYRARAQHARGCRSGSRGDRRRRYRQPRGLGGSRGEGAGGLLDRGIADYRGEAAEVFAYPEPEAAPSWPPRGGASAPDPLSEQQWPVQVVMRTRRICPGTACRQPCSSSWICRRLPLTGTLVLNILRDSFASRSAMTARGSAYAADRFTRSESPL
jgi:hypothetical protein